MPSHYAPHVSMMLDRSPLGTVVVVTTDESADHAFLRAIDELGWFRIDHKKLGTEAVLQLQFGDAHRWADAAVDQAILALGDHFVGTDGSQVSPSCPLSLFWASSERWWELMAGFFFGRSPGLAESACRRGRAGRSPSLASCGASKSSGSGGPGGDFGGALDGSTMFIREQCHDLRTRCSRWRIHEASLGSNGHPPAAFFDDDAGQAGR